MKKLCVFSFVLALMGSLFLGCGGNTSSQPAAESKPAASSGAAPGEQIKLVLGHTNAETDSRQTEVVKFAKLVEERTNGAVKVEVYASGVLGTAREMVEGLQVGLDHIVVEGYNCVAYFSNLAYDTLPFLYDNYDHFMASWYDSDVGKKWIQIADSVNITAFAPSFRGFRIVTSKKPFKNAQEVKGLKIRTPGTQPFIGTWQALETQATPMNLAEVLTGLQQGTIEAQENPVIMSYNYGFYDVCKYVIKTNHVCGADIFMMDKSFFNTIDPKYQTIIKDSAVECAKEISKYNVENENAFFEKFKEKGATILDADVESFRKKLANFVDDVFPQMKDMVAQIKAVKY
jgi:tripartite ATP-independent transporter DctP family solute receptor